MEKIIDFNGINVAVTWHERLKAGTTVHVHTSEPGLAINIIELFLDEVNKRNLWYGSGFLDYEDYQEMMLTKSNEDDWDNWTREQVLAKKSARKNKRRV